MSKGVRDLGLATAVAVYSDYGSQMHIAWLDLEHVEHYSPSAMRESELDRYQHG